MTRQLARYEAVGSIAPIALIFFTTVSVFFVVALGVDGVLRESTFPAMTSTIWPTSGALLAPIIALVPLYLRIEKRLLEEVRAVGALVPGWVFENPSIARVSYILQCRRALEIVLDAEMTRIRETPMSERSDGDRLSSCIQGMIVEFASINDPSLLQTRLTHLLSMDATIVQEMIDENWRAAQEMLLDLMRYRQQAITNNSTPASAPIVPTVAATRDRHHP